MISPRLRSDLICWTALGGSLALLLTLGYEIVRARQVIQLERSEDERLQIIANDFEYELESFADELEFLRAALIAEGSAQAALSSQSTFRRDVQRALDHKRTLLSVVLVDSEGLESAAWRRGGNDRTEGESAAFSASLKHQPPFLPEDRAELSGSKPWTRILLAETENAETKLAGVQLGTVVSLPSANPVYLLLYAQAPRLQHHLAEPELRLGIASNVSPSEGGGILRTMRRNRLTSTIPLGHGVPVASAADLPQVSLILEIPDVAAHLGLPQFRATTLLAGVGVWSFFALAGWLLPIVMRRKPVRHQPLEAEQDFTRSALDQLPLPVYYKDANGRYLGGNRALEELFGRPMKEIKGRHFADFYTSPEQAFQLASLDQSFLAGGTMATNVEVSFLVERNGRIEQRDLINYRARFHRSGHASDGIVGILLDVTEKRQAERRQAEMEVRLRKLAENLPGTIFQYQEWPDGSCAFPYASEGIERVFGVSPAEVLENASVVWDRMHPDDLEAVAAAVDRSAKTLEALETQYRTCLPDGRTLWLSTRASPERLSDGSTLWHGYIGDITDIKNTESGAHQNAELLRTMFENLPDRVYYKDRDCRYLGGSRAWWKDRGEELDEIIGKTDADFYPEELAQELLAAEREIIATGKPARRRETHSRPDGSVYYLDSLKCPFYGPDGTTAGVVGISRDITEQVEAEEHLIRAKEAAEEASRAKSEFLAMMSHEIRTPMNGVIGATSILLNSVLTDEQQEFVRTIQVSGENLLVIINDILDYSKIEAGRLELEEADFSLHTCIDDALSLFATAAAEKNIEIACEIDPRVPWGLRGDATRLRQVLVNLLSNAVKFTERGEVVLTVEARDVTSQTEDCELLFEVRDTGVGVAPERRHRLFQPFSQADASNTRRFGGTGLGLVISRRLIELMQGSIGFESELGKGSTFHFTARFRRAHHPLRSQGASENEADVLAGKHLVIVDDNATNRRILAETVKQWGMQSSSYDCAQTLLAEIEQVRATDGFILDFQMPEMDGVMLAEMIATLPHFQELPIILLSSVDAAPPSDAVHLRISKPVRIQSLRQHLQRLLSPDSLSAKTSSNGPCVRLSEPRRALATRILVAEDNTINQRLNEMMLQRLGYEPVIVSDGEAAVAACRKEAFEIILMDVQMPRMDGLEATRLIRALDIFETQPHIVALTAGAMDADRDAARQAGMNEFLAKPLKLEQLKQLLNDILLDPGNSPPAR